MIGHAISTKYNTWVNNTTPSPSTELRRQSRSLSVRDTGKLTSRVNGSVMARLVIPIKAVKKCVIIKTEKRYVSRIPLVKKEFKYC